MRTNGRKSKLPNKNARFGQATFDIEPITIVTPTGGTVVQFQPDDIFVFLPPQKKNTREYKSGDVESMDDRYAFQAFCTVANDLVQTLVEEMHAHNIWDDTLLLFFSDNGADRTTGILHG